MQPSLDDLLIDLESQKNANESEKSNRILTESIEKLKQENDSLIYGLAGAHDSKTAVKVEQAYVSLSISPECRYLIYTGYPSKTRGSRNQCRNGSEPIRRYQRKIPEGKDTATSDS